MSEKLNYKLQHYGVNASISACTEFSVLELNRIFLTLSA